MTSTTVLCPKCGTPVPKLTHFLSWCECGWNVTPNTFDTKSEKWRFAAGERIFHRMMQGKQSARTITTVVSWFIMAIFLLLCIGILDGAVWLFQVQFVLAKAVGLLLLLAFTVMVLPLVRKRSKKSTPLKQMPAVSDWLDLLAAQCGGRRFTHIRFYKYPIIQIERSVFGRGQTLLLGTPLLDAISKDVLSAGIIREICYHALTKRIGLDYVEWAKEGLQQICKLVMDEGLKRERIVGTERRSLRMVAVNQWSRVLLLPVAAIPFVLYKMLERCTFELSQTCVYQANQRASHLLSRGTVTEFVETLSLYAPISYALEATPPDAERESIQAIVKDKLSSLPRRELDRLMRASTEANYYRPMVHWQLSVLAKISP